MGQPVNAVELLQMEIEATLEICRLLSEIVGEQEARLEALEGKKP